MLCIIICLLYSEALINSDNGFRLFFWSRNILPKKSFTAEFLLHVILLEMKISDHNSTDKHFFMSQRDNYNEEVWGAGNDEKSL